MDATSDESSDSSFLVGESVFELQPANIETRKRPSNVAIVVFGIFFLPWKQVVNGLLARIAQQVFCGDEPQPERWIFAIREIWVNRNVNTWDDCLA